MREPNPQEAVEQSNERSLSTLARAITLSDGQFALILVRCNYEICKAQMWQRLQALTGIPLSEFVLQKSTKTLFTTLLQSLESQPTSALIVFGLESVTALEEVLVSTNQVRDEFRKRLNFPLVLWVTEEVLQKLTRFAPDFKSWAATSIKFELPTDELLALWHRTTEELFGALLDGNSGEFMPNSVLNLAPECRHRQELESAWRDLQGRHVALDSTLRATRQLILGRDYYCRDRIDIALEQYWQSLQVWQQVEAGEWVTDAGDGVEQEDGGRSSPLSLAAPASPVRPHPRCLERVGVLHYHIGLCYCRQAQLPSSQRRDRLEQAGECFQAGIEAFVAAGRSDWVAQLTLQSGEVLQRLQRWSDLQGLALKALEDPDVQSRSVRLARAYGFLAAVAYERSDWNDAADFAIAALQTLESPQLSFGGLSQVSREILPLAHYHRGEYLLILAKARRQLGKYALAATCLEQARRSKALLPSPVWQGSVFQLPQLYLDILEELRSLYLEQGHYLQAFEIKQERRSVEQKYGLCPFSGATPLQPQFQEGTLSPLEIAAAGRQPDVQRLIERLSRNDHKLTVIHGSSGVGKSSLINAGLVPALMERSIGARDVLPVVQTVFRDWVTELAKRLSDALASWNVSRAVRVGGEAPANRLPYPFGKGSATPVNTVSLCDLPTILEQLRLSCEQNLLTVLIFDQFEEFFFACPDLEQRSQFYEFLDRVLNLPFVKVVLSLREDYLHYLLECERYSELGAINGNLLDRRLRYHLGDLSPGDAKNVIGTLAQGSPFQLEAALIDTLVRDLAAHSGAVRLIELQVVGAQLQAEKITTLQQYQALGADPKATLVERSLLNAIGDCGADNEERVWQVLFALTDERGTRPLKTEGELGLGNLHGNEEAGDDVGLMQRSPLAVLPFWTSPPLRELSACEADNSLPPVSLILRILVGTGLVFRLPEAQQDRYQLVHDYLVQPIREKYKQRAQSNIVAQLENSQMALLRVQRQRLRAIAVGMAMAILAVSAGTLGWRAEVQRRLAQALSLNAELSAISASSEALFASEKEFDALLEGLRAAKRLKQAESTDRLSLKVEPDTHVQVVTALSQAVYGTAERNRLEGHSDVIWHVSFAPDGQQIASSSRDNTVKLWHPDGTPIATLEGHQDSVTRVTYSPDGRRLASSSWDGTVRLWSRQGEALRTLHGHAGQVYGVSFSPDGQTLASAGSDGTIRLWTLEGKLRQTLRGHRGEVRWVSFDPLGEFIVSGGEDGTVRLWTRGGELWQTLEGHGGKVNGVVFSPDGQLLASASDDRTVKLWHRQGELLNTLEEHDSWVFGVAFSADGRLIASASEDGTVKLWNRQGSLLETFQGHNDGVTAVSFSPQGVGDVLEEGQEPSSAAPMPILASASFDKTVRLWGGRDPSRLILRGHQDAVREVVFSPNDRQIATASNDGTVKLWTRQGELLKTFEGHRDRVYGVSFSPDGERLASASRDRTVKLWTLEGRLLQTLRGHQDWVLDVNFSPDGRWLASASRDGTLRLWSRDGQLQKTLIGHRDRVNAVSFSPDSSLLASASDDRTVKLWTPQGTLQRTLRDHRNWVLDVSFSPDGQFLVSASYDNTVKLWTPQGELLTTLKGHTDSVARARFSPTGKVLATIGWDNRVQLWRLDDTLIKTLETDDRRVTSISWSHDGKALAVATQDKVVTVWNLDLDDLLHKGCRWLQDYLENNPKVRESDRNLCTPIETSNRVEN